MNTLTRPANHCYAFEHPAVTTDIVIFTIREGALNVLLIQRSGEPYRHAWALPGGFVNSNEALDECAKRELEEETGLRDVYLEQLYTFGEPHRDPRERVISVAYYALIPSDRIEIRAATDAAAVAWQRFDTLPPLAFDHAQIVAAAQQRLVAKLSYSTIAFQFMPEKFTLGQLQTVYETISAEPIDKRNFRKWVLGLGRIEATGEERRDGQHRPAKLYRQCFPGKVENIR